VKVCISNSLAMSSSTNILHFTVLQWFLSFFRNHLIRVIWNTKDCVWPQLQLNTEKIVQMTVWKIISFNFGKRYQDMIDHRSYAHTTWAICKLKAWHFWRTSGCLCDKITYFNTVTIMIFFTWTWCIINEFENNKRTVRNETLSRLLHNQDLFNDSQFHLSSIRLFDVTSCYGPRLVKYSISSNVDRHIVTSMNVENITRCTTSSRHQLKTSVC